MRAKDGRVFVRASVIALFWSLYGANSGLARSLVIWGGFGSCGREPCVYDGNDIVMVAHDCDAEGHPPDARRPGS
jgi:hypothetical protein